MAIRLEQPGASEATARAGSIIGKAQRAQEDRARVEREQVRADQDIARRKAQQVAMEWEMQKMQINSQRAFERELRGEDYRLAAEDRAADRAIERIETAKDLDFQYKTQERQRKQGVIDAERAAWEKEIKSGRVREDELGYRNAMSDLDAREIAIQTGLPYQKPLKPRSAASQVSEINATLELESYTQQDLIEAGLDPADFPGIAVNEDAVEVAIREQVVQIEQQGGQVYFNSQTGERIVSYDGGETWEPLGVAQEETNEGLSDETTGDKEGFLKRFLLSKPLEGRIPKSVSANFGVFDRNR